MTEQSPHKEKSKISLHLLGGGVTGAFFHFGVLAALDDHLSRRSIDMDVYVGSSAGSLVASACAIGFSPRRIVEAIMKDDHEIFHIRRKDIYRFSGIDWGGEILKFFWTLFYLGFLKFNSQEESPSFFWGLKDSLPSGLFSMRYYEEWNKEFFTSKDLPCFFSQIKKPLLIPAQDLDACRRVVFGSEGWKHVPIYKAVPASSAIPIFFKPVQIENHFYVDGGLGHMAHLDLSADSGADLIVMVNPMVPIDNMSPKVKIKTVFDERGRIKDKGFTYVYDQSARLDIQQKVHTAVHYLGYQRPDVDLLLMEPDRDDPTMFLYNPMEFESRRQIIEYAYELTQRKLQEHSELWKRTLDRHGVTMV